MMIYCLYFTLAQHKLILLNKQEKVSDQHILRLNYARFFMLIKLSHTIQSYRFS